MTLNRVMAIILRHFTQSGSFIGVNYVKQIQVSTVSTVERVCDKNVAQTLKQIHHRRRALLA